jgi:uncharacterized membrane protein YphA (DoxX/SURF4 family)
MSNDLRTSAASKRTKVLYWISTILFAALMLSSAIPNIMSTSQWVEIMDQLGYPRYLLPFLGVAKLLGAIAILLPGYPRLKEWAYAGFFFDLTGVVYSSIAKNGFHVEMLFMLVWFGLLALSYIYYHKKKRSNNIVKPIN